MRNRHVERLKLAQVAAVLQWLQEGLPKEAMHEAIYPGELTGSARERRENSAARAQDRALSMRRAGASFAQIGRAYGINAGLARFRVKEAEKREEIARRFDKIRAMGEDARRPETERERERAA